MEKERDILQARLKDLRGEESRLERYSAGRNKIEKQLIKNEIRRIEKKIDEHKRSQMPTLRRTFS